MAATNRLKTASSVFMSSAVSAYENTTGDADRDHKVIGRRDGRRRRDDGQADNDRATRKETWSIGRICFTNGRADGDITDA